MINIYDFLEKYYYCPVCNNKCDVYAHFYNSILVNKNNNNNYNFGSYSIAPSSFISKGLQYNKFNFGGSCCDFNHSFSFLSEKYESNFEIQLRWLNIIYNNLILSILPGSEENLYSLNIKDKRNNNIIILMQEDSKFIDPKECFKVLKKVIDNEIFL